MLRHEFPDCCGIEVITGFPFSELDEDDVRDCYTKVELVGVRMDVERRLAQYIDDIKHEAGFLLVALNEVQKKFLGSVLSKKKFRLIQKARNPNTALIVYLYSYNYDKNKQVAAPRKNRVF